MSMGNLESGIMLLAYAYFCSFNSLCVICIYVCVSLYTQYIYLSFAIEKQPTSGSVAVGNKYTEQ